MILEHRFSTPTSATARFGSKGGHKRELETKTGEQVVRRVGCFLKYYMNLIPLSLVLNPTRDSNIAVLNFTQKMPFLSSQVQGWPAVPWASRTVPGP